MQEQQWCYRLTFFDRRVPFFSLPFSLTGRVAPSSVAFRLLPVPFFTLTVAIPPRATCASAAAQSAEVSLMAYLNYEAMVALGKLIKFLSGVNTKA